MPLCARAGQVRYNPPLVPSSMILKENHDVQGADSLSEQIADYLAERIIRGELAPGERIQEQKVTQALNVSRGSVREALLILERRHLVAILARRGAHVTRLDERSVRSLCALMGEFYILLGNAVAQKWRSDADLRPFLEIQQRLQEALEQQDIKASSRKASR